MWYNVYVTTTTATKKGTNPMISLRNDTTIKLRIPASLLESLTARADLEERSLADTTRRILLRHAQIHTKSTPDSKANGKTPKA